MSIVAKRLDGSLGTEVSLGPGDIVLDRAQLSPKGARPQFSAHVYCGPTVAHVSSTAELLFCFFGFVRQIKLAKRQLLGARK